MDDRDILTNVDAEHHEDNHGTVVPPARDNGDTPKGNHKDGNRRHHQGGNQSQRRNSIMKNKMAQTLTGVAFSIILGIGLSSGYDVKAAEGNLDDLRFDNIRLNDTKIEEINLDGDKDIDAYKLADAQNVDIKLVDNFKLDDAAECDNFKIDDIEVNDIKLDGDQADNVDNPSKAQFADNQFADGEFRDGKVDDCKLANIDFADLNDGNLKGDARDVDGL